LFRAHNNVEIDKTVAKLFACKCRYNPHTKMQLYKYCRKHWAHDQKIAF